MFHNGDRKNKYSINAIEGSEFESLLEEKVGSTIKSDSESYKIAWLDLRRDTDFAILDEIVAVLRKFENTGFKKTL
jgi:hypothetical protein